MGNGGKIAFRSILAIIGIVILALMLPVFYVSHGREYPEGGPSQLYIITGFLLDLAGLVICGYFILTNLIAIIRLREGRNRKGASKKWKWGIATSGIVGVAIVINGILFLSDELWGEGPVMVIYMAFIAINIWFIIEQAIRLKHILKYK